MTSATQIDIPPGVPKTWQGKTLRWTWTYRDAAGQTLGFVARYDDESGKACVPFFRRNGNRWQAGGPPEPRPLFGLETLDVAKTDEPVFICEGEKCCAALHSLQIFAVSSLGGSRAPHKTDWNALQPFQNVVLLPDNDVPGEEYAQVVADILRGLPGSRRAEICRLPSLPEKGDVVDFLQSRLPSWDGFTPIPPEAVEPLREDFLIAVERNAVPVPVDTAPPQADSGPDEEPEDEVETLEAVNPLTALAMPPPTISSGPRPGTLAVLAGPPGVSKSFFSLQLAVSAATSTEIFPSFRPVRPQKVLMLNWEDSPSAIFERLRSIFGGARDLESPTAEAINRGDLEFYFPESPMFQTSRVGTVDITPSGFSLFDLVLAARPDHVFLDNLAVAAVLQAEDNASFASIAAKLSRLAREIEGTVWLLHHSNKAGSGTANQNSIRGGSSLAGAVRWAAMLTPIDENDPTNALVKLTIVKSNYDLKPPPVILSRGIGGVLTESEQPPFSPAVVAGQIRDWLKEHREARVTENGINRRSPDGEDLLKHLLSSDHRMAPWQIRQAVSFGLKNEILSLVKVNRENSRNKVCILKPGHFEEVEE